MTILHHRIKSASLRKAIRESLEDVIIVPHGDPNAVRRQPTIDEIIAGSFSHTPEVHGDFQVGKASKLGPAYTNEPTRWANDAFIMIGSKKIEPFDGSRLGVRFPDADRDPGFNNCEPGAPAPCQHVPKTVQGFTSFYTVCEKCGCDL